MSEFKYQAINPKGKTVSGVIDATSERDAKKSGRLRLFSSLLMWVRAGKSKIEKTNGLFKAELFERKCQGEKLGLEFLKRLNELHGSGMPVADSVKLLNLRLSIHIKRRSGTPGERQR